MKKFIFYICLNLCVVSVWGQSVEVIKWNQLEQILQQTNDTTYILNFWATWCKPCIEELPEFEKLGTEFASKNVKILLISLDFVKEVEPRLLPFIRKNSITNKVMVLNEPDANNWINKINEKWSGAIPATLILNNKKGKNIFWEQKLTYTRLRQEVLGFL